MGTFNERLIQHKDHAPHRSNLLQFLAARQDAVQQLENFKTQGEGSITEGVMGAISATIKGAGDAGSEIIEAIAKGLETTTTGVGNATANIIGATGTAVRSIIKALGGIPGIILFVGEIGIIIYLFWIRKGRNQEKRKKPEVIIMSSHSPGSTHSRPTCPPPVPTRKPNFTEKEEEML